MYRVFPRWVLNVGTQAYWLAVRKVQNIFVRTKGHSNTVHSHSIFENFDIVFGMPGEGKPSLIADAES